MIAESLDSQKDISAFAVTTIRLITLLNNFLYQYIYQYNVKHHNALALLWAGRTDHGITMQSSLNAGEHATAEYRREAK